jgi:hypothetical protein
MGFYSEASKDHQMHQARDECSMVEPLRALTRVSECMRGDLR